MRNPITVIKKLVSQYKAPKRSGHWRVVRRVHLTIEGWCRNCGGIKNLEVHHVVPFHLAKDKELDPTNLITLCEAIGRDCHLKKGHLGNWKKANEKVREECTVPKPQ